MTTNRFPGQRSTRTGLHPILILISIFSLLGSAFAQAQPSNDEWRHTRQEWNLPLPAKGALTVENPWGDIRIRTHDQEQIYVLANIQNHQDDQRPMSLVIDNESSDKLGLKAHFSEEFNGSVPTDWQPRRIDLTLFVPAKQNLQLQTDKGLIEVRGHAAPLAARSVTGEIRVRVKSSVALYSEFGPIEVFFLRSDWPEDAQIETRTGPIEVSFPQGARAQLELETHGQITTDFSIDITRDKNESLKTATAKIGKKSKRAKKLKIKSDRGPVKLLSAVIPDESQ